MILVDIDGQKIRIDQSRQELRILDAAGCVMFRDRIQVAAGSVQGLFSAVEDAAGLTQPVERA